MTIVAGFKCEKGIVICADTQETIPGLLKRNIPKLRFEPHDAIPEAAEMAAVFAGATDNGPFLDRLVSDCWKAVQMAKTLEEASSLAGKALEEHYARYSGIYQPGYCPSAELVFGIKMHGASRLFHACDAVVNEVVEPRPYVAVGAGRYLADFLIPRSFHSYLNLYECIAIAAYVLFQAKEHVDGCGGMSDIAFLRNDGKSGNVEYAIVDTVTHLARLADSRFGGLLPKYCDPSTKEEELERLVKNSLRSLTKDRDERLKKLSEWNDFWKKAIEDMGFEE